jgi:hypothetical protein
MKRILPFLLRSLLLLPAALFAAGCHPDHFTDDWDDDNSCRHDCGDSVTRTFDQAGFDEIEIHSAFRLTVRPSDTFRVRITVPERSEDNIQVQRNGNRLRLSLEHGLLDGEARAVVELPLLRRVEAHDASQVRLERVTSDETVQIGLEDASQLEGTLEAQRTILTLSKASQARLDGRTTELQIHLSDASEAHLRELPCKTADVKLGSISSATIDVRDSLDVTASGLSVLHYYGDPEIGRKDLSSGGRIEHEH